MNRKVYMYWVLPLFTLLSSIPIYFNLLGTIAALILALILLVTTWGVVWMRLYMTQLARAEFSILAILPMAFYTYLRAVPAALDTMGGAMWSNLYFFFWVGTAVIGFISFKPAVNERPAKGERDVTRIILSSICIIFCLATWVQTSSIFLP